MSKTFTVAEVAKHKTEEEGVYIIIDSTVYDVTSMSPVSHDFPFPSGLKRRKTEFLDDHPGGAKILKRMGGKDSSKQFWKYHNQGVLTKYGEKLKIGTVAETAKL